MKKYILRSVKLLCLALVLVLSLGFLQEFVLCHADHNRQRVKGFFCEEENSLDIVFMGASDVYADYAPGYAYKQNGLTSYLFATQANSILNYKNQLKNIIKHQSPKLIVIELNGALNEDVKDVTKEANLRNYVDNIPLDELKLEWVEKNGKDNYMEYLFPILKYHGLWNTLAEDNKYQRTIAEDKLRGYNYLKGILNVTSVYKSDEEPLNDTLKDSADEKAPLSEIEERELRDLLEFCKSEKLDNVVFARFPHIVKLSTYNRFFQSNTVGDIVAEYGFDYLNFERDFEDTGLDVKTDFYNLDHLNVYGQKKFTDYLTNYLQEHYSLTPRELSGSLKVEWETCADYYDAYYSYSDSLIKKNESVELSEDCELIEKLKNYLPE